MSWNYYGFRPYVPVAERQARAARQLAKLSKKSGVTVSPVRLDGRTIARTFWGKAWCDNLEAYSDFENRLPRGRTYVRNGSVVDLQIKPGKVTARVAGSDLYTIQIKIKPLASKLWACIQSDCAGKIDSLMELLQGRLSSAVMEIVTRREQSLFPAPAEIDMDCSCPDWAGLCKHVAAALYGVGARLDEKPELLFLLRGVDASDLISRASASEAVRQSTRSDGAPALSESEMAEVFGIELAPAAVAPITVGPDSVPAPEPASTPTSEPIQVPLSSPKLRKKGAARTLTPASRARVSAVVKARQTKTKAPNRRRKKNGKRP